MASATSSGAAPSGGPATSERSAAPSDLSDSSGGLSASSSKPPPAPKKGFKLVLLGDAAVGKSSILMRFLQNKFTDGIETTVGAAFSTKTIECRNRQVKFEIWDTAGQERFRSLAPMYYRGASSAMVVYDQTNPLTFERAQEWVRQVMSTVHNPNIVVALVANKMDLADQRSVPLVTAEAYAEREGLLFQETSAKTGKNVLSLFEMIASHLPDEPYVPEQRGLVVSSAPASTSTGRTLSSKPPPKQGCCG